MLSITTDLITRTLPEPDKFELIEDLGFYHKLTGAQVVPKGFVTDFASIPPFLKRRHNVNDVHREESVVHDWLYENFGRLPNIDKLTRKECDKIYYDGLKKEYPRLSRYAAWEMYTAIRWFGGRHLYKLTGKKWEEVE